MGETDRPSAGGPGSGGPGSGGRLRIVIVDDDPMILTLVGRVLESDFDLSSFDNTAAARDAIAQVPPDLVLSDIFMPGDGGGYELIPWLRLHHPDVRVIAMTGGDANAENQTQRLTAIGAAAVLDKPFRPPALLQAIKAVMAAPA